MRFIAGLPGLVFVALALFNPAVLVVVCAWLLAHLPHPWPWSPVKRFVNRQVQNTIDTLMDAFT